MFGFLHILTETGTSHSFETLQADTFLKQWSLVRDTKVWDFNKSTLSSGAMKPSSSHSWLSFSETLSFILLDYVGLDPCYGSGNVIPVRESWWEKLAVPS